MGNPQAIIIIDEPNDIYCFQTQDVLIKLLYAIHSSEIYLAIRILIYSRIISNFFSYYLSTVLNTKTKFGEIRGKIILVGLIFENNAYDTTSWWFEKHRLIYFILCHCSNKVPTNADLSTCIQSPFVQYSHLKLKPFTPCWLGLCHSPFRLL